MLIGTRDMTAGTHINDLASAALRGLRMLGRRPVNEQSDDIYERTPLTREELSKMFALDGLGNAQELRLSELRESERRERDSMSIIRAALYPSD